jgi:hypothetical protein
VTKHTFQITIDVADEDDNGGVSLLPTKREIKQFLTDQLSWNHPHDSRRYFRGVKIIAKRSVQ